METFLVPKQRISDDVWSERLPAAKKHKKTWENQFKIPILYKYYSGFQWKTDGINYNPYTINKFYETIQIKCAQFIPTFPKYVISTRELNEISDMASAARSAQLKEDLLNQIVSDNRLRYTDEVEQAYKESFFAFGICEVGYSADWITNPQATPPATRGQLELTSGKKSSDVVVEPPELPKNEQVYIKHIPARSFFIGGSDHAYLARCGWCGYYEYVDRDDLLSLPKLMNKDKLLFGVSSSDSNTLVRQGKEDNEVGIEFTKSSAVRVWHIWDLRTANRLLLLDSPVATLWQRHFDQFPLFDFRPDKDLRSNGFYPVPPAFHWLSPQDEYNETREMLRAHRRRFVRKFQVVEGRIDDQEIEKFETGADGALVKVKAPDSITPIQNADLGHALDQTLATSADDLNRISGTTDESRGVADRTTATQATIVNQRTALRETKERDRIVDWLCQIGRAVLLTVNKNFTGRMLVRLSAQEGSESYGGTVQELAPTYKYVTSEDLSDGYDFKIDIDLTSMSVSARDDEKRRLFEFTAYLTQNPAVAFSPYLIREAAVRIGYRNEKAIAEFQKQALLMELARQLQVQAQVKQGQAALAQMSQPQMPPNGGAPQQMIQRATPPDQEQTQNQISQAMPQAIQ